jgi:hypothetical protein
MPRLTKLFAALIATQAAHSVEEYLGRLYESFPPATFVSRLFSQDVERGFVVANALLLAVGAVCVVQAIRQPDRAARYIWPWIIVEMINGVGHPLWSLRQGGYAPGVATAPFLFVLALLTARELQHVDSSSRSGTRPRP